MVRARRLMPYPCIASVIRTAALPVGAATATLPSPTVSLIRPIILADKYVLPVPGPPVITAIGETSASAAFSRWWSLASRSATAGQAGGEASQSFTLAATVASFAAFLPSASHSFQVLSLLPASILPRSPSLTASTGRTAAPAINSRNPRSIVAGSCQVSPFVSRAIAYQAQSACRLSLAGSPPRS